MDFNTAHRLNELNKAFYRVNGASFSLTRSSAWEGWHQLAPYICDASSILDVACGNMRFRDFACEVAGAGAFEYRGVDVVPPETLGLQPSAYVQADIVRACLGQGDVDAAMPVGASDLVVAFGFFHHIPGNVARMRLLSALVDKTAAGGIAVASFWNFMGNGRIARNARRITDAAQSREQLALDEGDYLLGWQGSDALLRYCHSFARPEVEMLAHSVSDRARVDRIFEADGRQGPMNTYLVLRKSF